MRGAAEVGLDSFSEQKIEPAVAIAGKRFRCDDAVALGSGAYIGDGCNVRIDTDEFLERRRVTYSLRRTANQKSLSEIAEQLHPGLHIIADAIPFDDCELGIMQRPNFCAANRMRHLINGPGRIRAAACQHPLHGEFRRSLQP